MHFVADEERGVGAFVFEQQVLKFFVPQQLHRTGEILFDERGQFAGKRADVAVGNPSGEFNARLAAHVLFDPAQTFDEDGTSDYNCVDLIREAGATLVAAAQSTTSFVPPLGNDKSEVLTLNLRNRLIFRVADEADAVQAADFLGKKRVVKRSWGFGAGKRDVNYSEMEEYKSTRTGQVAKPAGVWWNCSERKMPHLR